MSAGKLYRVILPVPETEAGVEFYARLFDQAGERVAPGRHYFECGGVICAVVDTNAEAAAHGGESFRPLPNQVFYYFAVDDLEAWQARAEAVPGAEITAAIQSYPWGERSFYLRDPWGNRLCFVDEPTLFTGDA